MLRCFHTIVLLKYSLDTNIKILFHFKTDHHDAILWYYGTSLLWRKIDLIDLYTNFKNQHKFQSYNQ